MTKMCSMKFDGTKGVCKHIMEIRDIAAQFKSLEIEMFESFLVHFILNSLPSEYEPFNISYNTYKEKWSINELLTMCARGRETKSKKGLKVPIWQLKKRNQARKVKESKRHLLIMLIRTISSASFARRKDTSRRVVPNLRLGLKKKVISSL